MCVCVCVYPDVLVQAIRQHSDSLMDDVIQRFVGPMQRVLAHGQNTLSTALHEASAHTRTHTDTLQVSGAKVTLGHLEI